MLTRPAPLLLLGALALGGCVRLGPDFQAPGEAWTKLWSSPALEQASQRRAYPDVRQWWQVFADPVLDGLIAEADAHNSNLKIAGLRVMEARARLGIAQSGRYPQLQQASAESLYINRRQYGGNNPQDSHFWQHSVGFDVGWELDFWGRFSRAIESSDASYFAAQANYEDVLVLLRAQVADTYFSLRTTEARLRVARENAEQQKRNFEITEKLFNSGQSAELDLQQAKTQYLGTLSSIPELEGQVLRTRNALAVLIGQPPNALPRLLENQGLIPLVDRAVLQDVPASLLLRRPDVRAAELNVAAQSALIGVAETDFYPSLTLLGSIVWSTDTLKGTSNSLDLIGGPSLRWNLFDHGQISNNVRVQDARLQQLIEVYRDKVREAAREADDAASGLSKSLERERILSEAQVAAKRSLSLANSQYREGYSDFQRVLDAQRALLEQQDNYLVSRSNAVSNLIALYKALGGGWYSAQPTVDPDTRQQMEHRTDWGNLLHEPAPSPALSSTSDKVKADE
ncbi:NodT family efflux transporter outer membrane factor (OMF) lipoprotein [Pseudomonas sp. PvR086]|jgi:NodT family efflux transporter outer membrane factor (OMF) lipoprotein|uniref:efflux transporter outer membrane subunit n=1 Tax=Pseudomonas TaxID=286 RepID=UPI000B34F4A9|nr:MULTISPECIES: TolC family protein [Pseudomonas]MBD9604324.1 TolC family protein [Pseudomonas sp. PDM08]MDR7104690.1 NodT family efflux transporter outer membrane factor (OMF) lipoprotein [Pseudomonas frederiksbergensis]PMY52655.1 TolC family protein [Pseudomonas sp. FW305-53]PMY85541.1 TolC family protein [Pseudomonas sp. FW303-C2]PMY92624.1 TolC family protein [Pseudomonas sp. FW305-62]